MTGGMIIKPPVSALDQYDPNRHRLNVAAIDYSIDEAKRIRDWPALEKAVDAKIEEQIRFVAWWKGSVAHGGGSKNRERGSYSLRDAEHLTGMSQQRVSDLTKRLALPAKYRERLLGSGYFAAFLASVENVRGTTPPAPGPAGLTPLRGFCILPVVGGSTARSRRMPASAPAQPADLGGKQCCYHHERDDRDHGRVPTACQGSPAEASYIQRPKLVFGTPAASCPMMLPELAVPPLRPSSEITRFKHLMAYATLLHFLSNGGDGDSIWTVINCFMGQSGQHSQHAESQLPGSQLTRSHSPSHPSGQKMISLFDC